MEGNNIESAVNMIVIGDVRAGNNDAICMTDLTSVEAVVSVDIADVQTAMKDKGIAQVGMGVGTGEDKIMEAIKMAIASPLLETIIEAASDLIVHIRGDISMFDTADAVSYIQNITGPEVNIIWGFSYDESELDTCRIMVIC